MDQKKKAKASKAEYETEEETDTEETQDAKPPKKSASVEVGAKVKFYPTHNKALELVGTIEDISDDVALVAVEPDGKFLEVCQTYTMPLREVRIANEGDANRHVGDRG